MKLSSLLKLICAGILVVVQLVTTTHAMAYVHSQELNSLEPNTYTIEMLAGLPKAPFIIEENGAGLQLDIIREAFLSVNHYVHFAHIPMARSITGFKRFNADGIITLPSDYEHPSIFMSKPYITYQNVAISLTDDDFSISSVQELSGKSVAAFQNAKKFLGDNFNKSVSLSTNYREIADQTQQVEMLYTGRVEVIVLDINIFKHFLKNHVGGRYNRGYKIHYIFNERKYSAGFRSAQYRNLFDQGIANIKEQGVYQLVLDQYL